MVLVFDYYHENYRFMADTNKKNLATMSTVGTCDTRLRLLNIHLFVGLYDVLWSG